jgi:abequosyltransferase
VTRLSICIPTYNFGAFIGDTLDSITANLRPGVEVIVLDGGSSDDTEAVVARRQREFPVIAYHRQAFRGGIDRDIATAVSHGRGEYCWLFSADDIMRPGSIDKVLAAIESRCDVYLCEHTLCAADLTPITEYPIFNATTRATTFDLANAAQRENYFGDARTSEAFFSYLAGPIFKRTVWNAADVPESFYGTCWAHAGRLLSRVKSGLVVRYTAEKLIYKRSGVDSFMDRGLVNRLAITIDGFSHIAETVFGAGSNEAFHMRRVTRNESAFRFRPLVSAKIMVARSGSREDSVALDKLVRRHYSDAGAVNKLKYFLFRMMPTRLLSVVKAARDSIRRGPKAIFDG